MDIYTIYVPEIGEDIQIKVISPIDLLDYTREADKIEAEDFPKYVLEKFVFNLPSVLKHVRKMSKASGENFLMAVYNSCVMLNPGLDIDQWLHCAYRGIKTPADVEDANGATEEQVQNVKKQLPKQKTDLNKPFRMTRSKTANLGSYLRSKVVGQEEAIKAVESVLRRSQAGLGDGGRPIGAFLFAGSSGTGKTLLAQELHKYLFGDEYDMIRIDCGEFQHKHENQKLTGSPPGFVGHDEGGQLTNLIKDRPHTVLLLDEVEKAHPDIFDTFLRLLDEGVITDNKGNKLSFHNTVIIMTTNLGNDKVVKSLTGRSVGFSQMVPKSGNPPREQVERETMESIRNTFKPEFLNRLDKIVIFNHLTHKDFKHIVELELEVTDNKLSKRGITLNVADSAIEAMVEIGVDPVKGARGIKQVRREKIESLFSDLILDQRCPRGTVFDLFYEEEFKVDIRKPRARANSK
jgi:ATP-dependent Clp protease ATP-binding subunit ClpA